MSVFDKIAAQQGNPDTAVYMVGEQLKDIIRNSAAMQELVEQDLENQSMSIAACEKKIKEWADKHRTGNFAFVSPAKAEEIIRKFYGLPAAGEEEQTGYTETAKAGQVLNLSDFF